MKSGFNDLGNLFTANYQEEDASVEEEIVSLANESDEEPPTKKKKSDKGDEETPHKSDSNNSPQSVILNTVDQKSTTYGKFWSSNQLACTPSLLT